MTILFILSPQPFPFTWGHPFALWRKGGDQNSSHLRDSLHFH